MEEAEYLTPQEVGKKLRMHERTVRRLLAEGSLPGQRIGSRQWRVSAAALKAYIETGQKAPKAKTMPHARS
jgi:excisionase family DNA binding protein